MRLFVQGFIPSLARRAFTLLMPEATASPATTPLGNALPGQPACRQLRAAGRTDLPATFDMHALPVGVYVLHLTLDGPQLIQRVVVE